MRNPLPDRSAPAFPLPRRRVLVLGAAVGLSAWLTGCTPQTIAAPIPLEPDELSVNRAVTAARTLRTDALALAGSRPELTVLLRRIAAVHEAHLAALGSPIAAASASPSAGRPTATGGPAPGATADQAPTPTPTRLIKAEIAAGQTALRDGEAAAPAFALLLCRIAAAQIVNADLLSPAIGRNPPGVLRPAQAARTAAATGSASPSSTGTASPAPDALQADSLAPTDLTDPTTPAQIALNRLLAGEHAAVFAYPLIIARAAANRRNLAASLWQAHRSQRDELTVRLLSASLRPAVADPAYDVGAPPSTAVKAATLAARVERGLAGLASDLLAAGTAGDDDRTFGADQLVLAARRTANWTGRPTAFPGYSS